MTKSKTEQLKKEIEKEDNVNPLFKIFVTIPKADYLKAELKGRQEMKKEILEEIKSLNDVTCVGMSKEFIKGSDWCNGLWKGKVKELKEAIEKK